MLRLLVNLLALMLLASSVRATAQTAAGVLLWPNGAPGALGNRPEDRPTLTPYLATAGKATGAAVIVCPGGGYTHLAPHEGAAIAEWLNTIGIKAFVLMYRLGSNGYRHPAMLQDAQRAVRYVRAHAAELGIDPQRIGMIGFSAGGHVASSAATHLMPSDAAAADPLDRVSSRPDLVMLIYPVITMGQLTHRGSRDNLLGKDPRVDLVELMSNEKQVTHDTPPAFLVHAFTDPAVPIENSLLFASALRKAGVPFELHVFEEGRHGFGLATDDPVLGVWPKLCEQWLRGHGF